MSTQRVLWHISSDTSSLASFLRKGAKAIGIGEGGQKDGFYVWSDREAAIKHADAMMNGSFSNKNGGNSVLLVAVSENKKSFHYPTWQLDLEATKGLFSLWCQHGDFLNRNATNLNIPVHPSNRQWRDIETITGLSYEKIIGKTPELSNEFIHFHLRRKDGREAHKIIWEDIDNGAETFKAEAITTYLCENDPSFLSRYDALLEHVAYTGEKASLKYTGEQPLRVDHIILLKKEKDDTLKEYPLYRQNEKPETMLCPFIKKKMADKTR
ncbi:MAG: hypothetical protein J6U64_02105 [Alphaproteobacteria bacterium]|nr:hypothetical protein [Alphaproteobacteria bacterium]